ncbi:hypothetical protein ACUODJ_37195, partial [Escherichia sp. HC-CC]
MVLAASCCCSADFRVFASAGAAVRLYTPQQKEHYRVLPFHPGFWYRNGCEMFFACQRSFGYGLVSSEVSHRTARMVNPMLVL